MREPITAYRRLPTQIRALGERNYDRPYLALGYLVFDPAKDEVRRYTPHGVLIDTQYPSLWSRDGGNESFESWLRQHHESWSIDSCDAYWDSDFFMDEGL